MGDYQVLYAEDEFTSRKLVEIHLKKAGMSFCTANDGIQAWDLCQEHSFDVIVLDQHMPEMNGDSLAVKILKQNPNQPLFAITSDDREIANLKRIGFIEVFIKPVDILKFIDSINPFVKLRF